VFSKIEKAARVDVAVLVTGETGTGKELVANEIHRHSPRANKPFVALNTGTLSRELMLSELFGHVKGAFTGASTSKDGRFEEAEGGTLFLDEVATMDDDVQTALLRVLEQGACRPVGATRDRKVDVRIVAATNMDLRAAVDAGDFRADLMHRFEVFRINLPPLRERISDLPQLCQAFLEAVNADFELACEGFSEEAFALLKHYPWPGNVRELKNVVAQSVVMAERGLIRPEHLPRRIHHLAGDTPAPDTAAPADAGGDAAEDNEPGLVATVSSAPVGEGDEAREGLFVPLGVPLEEVQRLYILQTLKHCANNKTHAARVLGVSRKTLYDRLAKWGESSAS
jgi:DNA-binding NtrC family response regulator